MRYTYIYMDSLMSPIRNEIKVADEVFLAIALLHREHPEKEDFTISEIVERAERENIAGELRPGVRVHVSLQCVANRPPNPGRYGMLYATANNRRRLLRDGDDVHPQRTGKVFSNPEDLPPQYRELVKWAKERYSRGGGQRVRWLEGLFQMAGTGADIWNDEDPDEYVRRLREGWE
jgi:hypothetical protein